MPHQHAELSQPTQQLQNQATVQERLPAQGAPLQYAPPTPPAQGASSLLGPNNLLYLQRTIGNRAVQRMLTDRQPPPQVQPALPLAGKAPRRALQRKEDEEIAPESVSSPLIGTTVELPKVPTTLQTTAQTTLQRKKEAASSDAPTKVQVHTNSHKAAAVGALAYTQGTNIHVAPGQYNPNSRAGASLLKHESAHVSQQLAGRVKPTKQMHGMAVNTDKGLEREADQWAKNGIAPKGAGDLSATSPAIVAQFKFPEDINEWISIVTSNDNLNTDARLWVELLTGMARDELNGKVAFEAVKDQVVITGLSGTLIKTPTELCVEAGQGELTALLRQTMAPKQEFQEKKASKQQTPQRDKLQNQKGNTNSPRAQSPTKGDDNTSTKSIKSGGVVPDKGTDKGTNKGPNPQVSKAPKELLIVGSHMSGDMYGVSGALALRPKLNVLILSDDKKNHVQTRDAMLQLFNSVKNPDQQVFVENGLTDVNSQWQSYVDLKIWTTTQAPGELFKPINITAETAWIREEFVKGQDEANDSGKENAALTKIKDKLIAPTVEGNDQDEALALGFMSHTGLKQQGKYALIWGKTGDDTHPHPQHYSSAESRKMLFEEAAQTGRTAIAIGDEIKGADTKPTLTRFWSDKEFPKKFKDEGRRGQLKFLHYFAKNADIVHVGMRSGILEGPALLGQKVIYMEEKGNDQAARWEKLVEVIPTFKRLILDAPPGAGEKDIWIKKVLWRRHKSEALKDAKAEIGELLGIDKDNQNQIAQVLLEHETLVDACQPLLELREKLLMEAQSKASTTKPTPTKQANQKQVSQKQATQKQTNAKKSNQKSPVQDPSLSTGGSLSVQPIISVVPTIPMDSTATPDPIVSNDPIIPTDPIISAQPTNPIQAPSQEEVLKLLMSMLEKWQKQAKVGPQDREEWQQAQRQLQGTQAKEPKTGEGMSESESGVMKQLLTSWDTPPTGGGAKEYHKRTWHKAEKVEKDTGNTDWVAKYERRALKHAAQNAYRRAGRAPEKAKTQGGNDGAQGNDNADGKVNAQVNATAVQDTAQTQPTTPQEMVRDKLYKSVLGNEKFLTVEPYLSYFGKELPTIILNSFASAFIRDEDNDGKKKVTDTVIAWFKSDKFVGSFEYEAARAEKGGESSKEAHEEYDLLTLLARIESSTMLDKLDELRPSALALRKEALAKAGNNLVVAYNLLCIPTIYPYLDDYTSVKISSEPLGEGKQKDAYEIDGQPTRVMAKMKKNDYFRVLSGELEMLGQIGQVGLGIVKVHGVTTHGGMPAVVMDRFAEHSKDFAPKRLSDFKNEKAPTNYTKFEPKPLPTATTRGKATNANATNAQPSIQKPSDAKPSDSNPSNVKSTGAKSAKVKAIASKVSKTTSIDPHVTQPQSTVPQSTVPQIDDATVTDSTISNTIVIDSTMIGSVAADSKVAQDADKKPPVKKQEDRYIKQATYLNEKTIKDLLALQAQMKEKQIRIKDLQFLIAKDGGVVVNDPGTVMLKTAPSESEIKVIDDLITATVHHLIIKAGGVQALEKPVVTTTYLLSIGVPAEKHFAVLTLLDTRYRLPVEETEEMAKVASATQSKVEEKKVTEKANLERRKGAANIKLAEKPLTKIQKDILKGLYEKGNKTEKGKLIPLGSNYQAADYAAYLGDIELAKFKTELKGLIAKSLVKPTTEGLYLLQAGEEEAQKL